MNNLEQDQMAESYDVAVIGMAGRFPGSENINAYWQTLRDGLEKVSFFSDDELMMEGFTAEELKNPNIIKARAILDDVELFDASFFNIPARAAEWMDPQHRLFLECAWTALEDAGYDASAYAGAIAVYAGSSLNTYMLTRLPYLTQMEDPPDVFQLAIANDKDHLATRVSYKLNLRGESVTIQTACSTSLVAIHFACQSLLSGQCDMALAGGVSIQVPQKTGYLYREGMIASPDGHCRAFDDKAQGTVTGNGLGIVVLKLLSEALKDGDHIYAVIKGSAINNDGQLKMGYTAPSIEGQTEVIAKALAMAGVEADTINYVEAHGTGTPVGDPIEVEALTQAYRRYTNRNQFCSLGAVKTNIGHLDAAAGVAGLIKVCLSLKHREIPPTLHFENPNRTIDFKSSPFYVNNVLSEWPRQETPRRAAVSSFGIGGTNAHVVLEESPTLPASAESRPFQLLTLSAKSQQSLEDKVEMLARHLEESPQINLADVAYTGSVGRQQFASRRFVVARNREEALGALRSRVASPASAPVATSGHEARAAFLFPGQGAQSVDMAKALYLTEPAFRRTVDDCALILKRISGMELLRLIYPPSGEAGDAAHRLAQPEWTLPALFTIEYALARLWIGWGLQPQAMIGHSFGEYVAACLAGVFTLEEGLMLSVERGRLMQRLPSGAMIAVKLPEAAAGELLTGGLAIASINGDDSVVISGPVVEIERLEAELAHRHVGCRRLDVPFAYHSSMIDPLLEEFVALMKNINLQSPSIPYVSCVTGRWIQASEATDPHYWAGQMRNPVRFAAALDTLVEGKCEVLLEVGPGQTLSTLAKQRVKHKDVLALSSLPRNAVAQDAEPGVLEAVGRMWARGCKFDWPAFYRNEKRRRLSLPTYPFERQRYWIDINGLRKVATAASAANDVSAAPGDTQKQEVYLAPVEGSGRHDVERSRLAQEFVVPRNEIEAKLAGIWGEVLGLKGIGIHDDFYDLGGDSLLATQVYARVVQSISQSITLQQVLTQQTIAGFAELIEHELTSPQQPDGDLAPLTISLAPRDAALPVSFAQQRMWFICRSAPNSSVYNLGNAIRMSGALDIVALEKSLQEIVNRHEILRTRFEVADGKPVQVVEPEIRFHLPLVDFSELPEAQRDEQAATLASEEARRPFDLSHAPLMRTKLVRMHAGEHVALFSMHHIISDAWSFGVLVREIAALYEAFSAGRTSPLPPLPIQYADFAYWQRQRLQGTTLEAQLDYWKRHLGGKLPILELPSDRPRPSVQSFRGGSAPFVFTPELTQSLEALTREENTTLFTLLLAAFKTLLHLYTKQDDIIVGSAIAGRQMLETENLIGLFVNTLALRTSCAGNPTFRNFFRNVRETTLGAVSHQDVPFEKLVEALQPERSLSHNPVFQVFFNFQNTPMPPFEIRGLTLSRLEYDSRAVALDLIFNILMDGDHLAGAVQYSTDLFDPQTIARMQGHFEKLLESIVATPDAELSALEFLSEEEKQQRLREEQEREQALRAGLRNVRRQPVEIAPPPPPTILSTN